MTGIFTACSTVAPPKLPQDVPAHWTHSTLSPDFAGPDFQSWWTVFADNDLNRLVTQALSHNLSLAQARQRIQQTRSLLGHAGDEFLPALYAHTQSTETADTRDTFFQYGLDANWELGLFGKHESVLHLAQAQMAATEAEAQTVQVSVIAEVVRTYIELRTYQQCLLLLQQQQQLEQQELQLLKFRVGLGLSSRAEVSQAEYGFNQLNAESYNRSQSIDEAMQRLALLLGEMRGDLDWLSRGPQPVLPSLAMTRAPADLLRTRPEIRSAEAAVLKASAEAGIARADIYPHISLGSAYIYSTNITQHYDLDNTVHSSPLIGPLIDIPLLDWGRRRAALKAQNIALDESLLAYRQAVLEAVAEGEIALSSLNWQSKLRQQIEISLNNQLHLKQNTQTLLDLGFSSAMDNIQQQRQENQLHLQLLEARASEDLAFIALYKALGGAPLPPQFARKES